jgi:NAD(P)-dependent dehydrogenase (short-subunit alcohol dehydrogenase family)
MPEKNILITGGNAGIGKAAAIELARMGHNVAIVSRGADKGKTALEEIQSLSGSRSVELIVGSLSDIRSVKDLAGNILKDFPGVNVLINNAGVWPMKREINADGLETAFMVNHMAPFILSNLLLERLKKNAPSRIVNVNAGLYIYGRLDLDKTPYGKDFGRLASYMNSKLCNIFFTQKFAELIRGSGVTVNAVHPGVIRTNLGIERGILGTVVRFMKRGLASPEEGAKPPVRLAVDPDVENVSGSYFDLFKLQPYAKNADNPELRDRLWDLSMKLAGL